VKALKLEQAAVPPSEEWMSLYWSWRDSRGVAVIVVVVVARAGEWHPLERVEGKVEEVEVEERHPGNSSPEFRTTRYLR
jgi:hypothetical protein